MKLGDVGKSGIGIVKEIYYVIFDFPDYVSFRAYRILDPSRS